MAAATKRFRLELLGDKALVARMRDLAPKIERKYLGEEMRKAFKVTLAAVLAAVPVATGALRKSIKLRAGKGGSRMKLYRIFTGNAADLGIPRSKQPGQRGGGGTGYYPFAIEAGYTLHGRTYAPRSYLRGPLRSTEPRVLAALRAGLWSRIRAGLTSATA